MAQGQHDQAFQLYVKVVCMCRIKLVRRLVALPTSSHSSHVSAHCCFKSDSCESAYIDTPKLLINTMTLTGSE